MENEQLGPYRLGKKLGQGGMGAVYAGVDGEGNPAAIKVLFPHLAGEEGFRARFEAEIDSLKKLRHPNIVRLFGYGEQKGTLFYAMELVQGSSLEEELRGQRRFTWREVTRIAVQICKALKHAHDHGVIHRDIKPANLLLTDDGQIKLSDFGIARLFGNTRMTSDGGVLGTAEFMAPEQADGRPVTDRCDQYSLGGVMYALLAGRPPFRAASLVEMLQLQRFAQPQSVRRFAPDTPEELDRIILQLLEKEPQKRFANALIVSRALEAMERGLSIAPAPTDFVVSASDDQSKTQIVGYNPLAPTMIPEAPDKLGRTDVAYSIADPATDIVVKAVRPGASGQHGQSTDQVEAPARFTKVEDEEDGSVGQGNWWALVAAPQSALLVLALLLLAGAAWYSLRPATADELYREIELQTDDGKLDSLILAEDKIGQFLHRFGDDPRSVDLRPQMEEITLAKLDRRLERNARRLARTDSLKPLERAYIEAAQQAPLNPEAARAKLAAILDLYGDTPPEESISKQCLELARRRLERLEKQIAADAKPQLELIESRLNAADQLHSADPDAAERIYRAIIRLYDGKPWAKPAVDQAKAKLKAAVMSDGPASVSDVQLGD
jgi:serine/threonine-protein kinase